MRKLFRMKHESCRGDCYDHSDVMRIHTLGLDTAGATVLLRRLLEVHSQSCGDPAIEFRLDADDELGIFVSSMTRHGAVDMFAANTPLAALDRMIDAALAYFESEEYREIRREHPLPPRHAACDHGTDAKLARFAIAYSGLNDVEQADLERKLGL